MHEQSTGQYLTLFARKCKVCVDDVFVNFLEQKKEEGLLDFRIN
jgi:predicted DCC family thiol-disulfide oxidoreductase YuxK